MLDHLDVAREGLGDLALGDDIACVVDDRFDGGSDEAIAVVRVNHDGVGHLVGRERGGAALRLERGRGVVLG